MEGQRGDVRLAPSFSALLHLLLKLHPPEEDRLNSANNGQVFVLQEKDGEMDISSHRLVIMFQSVRLIFPLLYSHEVLDCFYSPASGNQVEPLDPIKGDLKS